MRDIPVLSVPGDRLDAICLDVDGTLYDALPLRAMMICRIALGHGVRFRQLRATARILSLYRKAQEDLRARGGVDFTSDEQLRVAAELSGVAVEQVRSCVQEWFEEAPLSLLPRCARPGLRDFFEAAKASGIRIGILSDYPAQAKLAALGILPFCDVIVSAGEPAVRALKPHPAGLRRAMQLLEAEPAHTLYIGDRPEVDGQAAAQAGVQAVLVGSRRTVRDSELPTYADFHELTAALRQLILRSRQQGRGLRDASALFNPAGE